MSSPQSGPGFRQNSGFITNDQTLVLGTCQISQATGEVTKASLKRGSEEKVIKGKNGNARAYILFGVNTTLSVSVIFDSEVPLPDIGDPFQVPFLPVSGVIKSVDIEWENEGERSMTLEVSSWDGINTGLTFEWDGDEWIVIND